MVRVGTAFILGGLAGLLLGAWHRYRTEHARSAIVRPAAARGSPAGATDFSPAPRPFDLDSRSGLRDAIASVASDAGELVLLTSDGPGIRAAVNMALQLHRFDIRHHLVLMGARSDCERAQRGWPWLACGWSGGLAGFERYAHGTSMSADGVRLWALWSAKWLILARLVELRANVLALDTDMMVLADPYPTLTTAPLAGYTLVLPAEGTRVNLGAMYVRGAACAPGGGTASVLWDVVRRLRLFVEGDDTWLLRDRQGALSLQGVWDQGIFTDALESAGRGEHIYPYTYLQAPDHRAWNRSALGWPAESRDEIWRLHRVSWASGPSAASAAAAATRPPQFGAPEGHPQQARWARPERLAWLRLRPLPPLAGLPPARPGTASRAPGWLDPAALSPRSARDEFALATPGWLYCSPPHRAVTLGWPALPRGATCSLLHLVELRSQFVSYRSLDTLKLNRPYVMDAYGAWPVDEHRRLPSGATARAAAEAVRAASGAPSDATVSSFRGIRLGRPLLEATSDHDGVGALLNALQLLHVAAAVSGRAPVVPSVPCSARWLVADPLGIVGVADDYVMPLSERGGYRCHLSMGGAGCAWPNAVPAWLRSVRALFDGASPEETSASTLTATLRASVGAPWTPERPPNPYGVWCNESSVGLNLAFDVRALRREAAARSNEPIVELRLDFSGAEAQAARACWPSSGPRGLVTPSDDGDTRGGDSPRTVRARGPRLCSVPLAVEAPALTREERARFMRLHKQCAAYFAPPAAGAPGAPRTGRAVLDHMHRRRAIAEPDCAPLSAPRWQ